MVPRNHLEIKVESIYIVRDKSKDILESTPGSKNLFSKVEFFQGDSPLFCAKRSKDHLNPHYPSTWCSFISVYLGCRFRCTERPRSAGPPPPARFGPPRCPTGKVSFTKDATTRWWYIYGFRDRAGTRGGS